MKEKQKEMWKKWFRRDNLIVLVLSGVLLFIIALPTKEAGRDGEENAKSLFDLGGAGESRVSPVGGDAGVDAGAGGIDYGRQQEERLEKILAVMDGVGKVEVMLTISASEELVVEKDSLTSRSDTMEEDSAGGKRSVLQLEDGDTTVYRTSDGDSEPYVVKTLNPRVEGVLVVAEGAGKGTVNRSITEIAQALFGVEAHKVKVVPMRK